VEENYEDEKKEGKEEEESNDENTDTIVILSDLNQLNLLLKLVDSSTIQNVKHLTMKKKLFLGLEYPIKERLQMKQILRKIHLSLL
jgi:hypothetical protein